MVSLKICSALLLVVACATAASTNDLKHDNNNTSMPVNKTSAIIEPSSTLPGPVTSSIISLTNDSINPEPPKVTTSTTSTTITPPGTTSTTITPPSTTSTTSITPPSSTSTTTSEPTPPNSTTTTTSEPTPPNSTTTTTPKPTPTPTPTPNSTTTSTTTVAPSPEPTPGRRFDGPSFFGGLALGFSIMGIAYAAYRFFYFNRGGAYHTL